MIDPSISSFNVGDKIVSHYCERHLKQIFPDAFFIKVSAYNKVDDRTIEIIRQSEHIFFCGTAPITSEISFRWPIERWDYSRKVTMMGVGWNNTAEPDLTSRAVQIYDSNLSQNYYHAVRDNLSKDKLGYINRLFVNTSCPSMWDINKLRIDNKKYNWVVFTLNSARSNAYFDQKIYKMLMKKYEGRVIFFAQSPKDYGYFMSIMNEKPAHICQSSFEAYSDVLRHGCDYVGTRLHGGIHALNHYLKTVIVGVDNRAVSLADDFGLPVIEYQQGIDYMIEQKLSNYEINIELPTDNIQKWKDQFK